jgi:hypothetical protein
MDEASIMLFLAGGADAPREYRLLADGAPRHLRHRQQPVLD